MYYIYIYTRSHTYHHNRCRVLGRDLRRLRLTPRGEDANEHPNLGTTGSNVDFNGGF